MESGWRFVHYSVSGNECWTQLPARHGKGKIPGGNQADDSQRLPDGHAKLVHQLGGGSLSGHSSSLAGDILEKIYGFLNIAFAFCNHLAHFAAHQLSQFGLTASHDP